MPELSTSDLGTVSYQTEDVITFPEGIPSFEQLRQFLLVQREELDPFVFLFSVERPEVRFVCLPVGVLRPDYSFELTQTDCVWLVPAGTYSVHSPELMIFTIVTLPENAQATANLLAPVIINPARRVGAQVILSDATYSHVTPLWGAGSEALAC